MSKPTRGPFPLSIHKVEDFYLILTNHGTHYAKTFDPSAARLIQAGPDILEALQAIIDAFGDQDSLLIDQAKVALAKAKGGAK